MAYFQKKSQFWYLPVGLWYILRPLGIFDGFGPILPRFGMVYQGKPGNPVPDCTLETLKWRLVLYLVAPHCPPKKTKKYNHYGGQNIKILKEALHFT
jgi:hypothetical protein